MIEAENNRMIVRDMYFINKKVVPFMKRASGKKA